MDKAARETWEMMLPELEKEVSILVYDVWIKTLEPIEIRDTTLILRAPNEYAQERINSRFLDLLRAVLKLANSLLTDVEVTVGGELSESAPVTASVEVAEPVKPADVRDVSVNLKYTFENFVVGKSNELAFAAAKAVAEMPGEKYNPLFICGGSGLGKTHLMHAIGNYIKVSQPHIKIVFVSSEKFVNDLVASIGMGNGKGGAFRDKYRTADVLMVDDIQFISGKTATTEEIFHTFNELYSANKQLVFTSDRLPKEIPDIDERLRSRFEWGMTVDIQSPDLETRIAILRKKAQIQKYNIGMEVLTYMAGCISSNVREMEGLLNKVILLAQLNDCKPSIQLVQEAMKDYAAKEEGTVTVDDIIDATCKCFAVSRTDLIGKKKTKEIVEPRQICIYVITEMLDLPLASIGNVFSGRDHTTILYTRDKIANELDNPRIRTAIDNVKSMIYNK